eukprot:CAMPEP_0177609924 /NCGR_PEP_ID=MMETSP0419_2-20121207/19428_1 /TAXON_ID=582737 /ORGANISM="Tetraselmis sp., Strain GSL018" /LENGTH=1354 /DNA_ID=CAMNT_0019105041 /DNA_START=352 /DNA_END=4413 /DNA_ORIENTATION=-
MDDNNQAENILLLSMAHPATWKDVSEYRAWARLYAAGNCTTGFFVHGLWPETSVSDKPQDDFDPKLLPLDLQESLALYYRDSPAPAGSRKNIAFWASQWAKHGSRAGVTPLEWHKAILHLAEQTSVPLFDTVSEAAAGASKDTEVSVGDLSAALAAKFGAGGAVAAPGGLHCTLSADNATVLSEVRLCVTLGGGKFTIGGCSGPSRGSASCGPAKAKVLIPSAGSHREPFCFEPETEVEELMPRSCALGGSYVLSLAYAPAAFPRRDHAALARLVSSLDLTKGFTTLGLWRVPGAGDSPLPFSCSAAPAVPPGEWDADGELSELLRPLSFYARGGTASDPRAHIELWNAMWEAHGRCTGLRQADYLQLLLAAMRRYGGQRVDALRERGGIDADPTARAAASYRLADLREGIAAAFGGPSALLGAGGLRCELVRGETVLKEIRLCLRQQSGTAVLAPGGCEAAAGVDVTAETCGTDNETVIVLPGYQTAGRHALEVAWTVAAVVAATAVALALVALASMASAGSPSWASTRRSLRHLWESLTMRALFRPQPVIPVRNPLVSAPLKVEAQRLDIQQLGRDMPELAPIIADLPIGMGIKGGVARKIVKAQEGGVEPAGSFDIDVIVVTDREVTAEFSHELRERVTGTVCGGLRIEAQDVEVRARDSLRDYFITRDVTQNEVLLIKTGDDEAMLLASEQCREDCRLGRATPSVHGLTSGLTMVWDVDEDGKCFVAEHIMCRTIIRLLKGHANEYSVDAGTWAHYRATGLSAVGLFKILKHFHDDDHQFQAAIDHLVQIGLLSRMTIHQAGGANALWGQLIQEVNRACSRFGGRLKFTDLDPEAVERWIAQKKAKLGDKLVSNTWRAKRIGFIPVEEDALSLGAASFPQELADFEAHGAVFCVVPPEGAQPERSVQILPAEEPGHDPRSAGAQIQDGGHPASPRGEPDARTPLLEGQLVEDADGEREGTFSHSRLLVRPRSLWRDEASRCHEHSCHSDDSSGRHLHSLQLGFFELANPDITEEEEHPTLAPSSYGQPSKISRMELLSFVLGVAWPFRSCLLVAYGLLLSGLVFRLLTSKFEGDTLNALQDAGSTEFSSCFRVTVFVWVLSLLAEVAGGAFMQVFARNAMQGLFTKLFAHLINQDIDLFKHLTVGEVSARCSGDSLTLKACITFTAYSIVAGSIQAVCALLMLTISAVDLFKFSPVLAFAAPAALCLEVAYSVGFGALVAHPLNHSARRSLGRMYGFLYDTFSQIPTVQTLGLTARHMADYAKFVSHYWQRRLSLDLWLAAEGGFTSAVGIALTLVFLLNLGRAYFASSIFGIGTIYTVLRYVQIMQNGVKSASDGCARMAASLGSVERL